MIILSSIYDANRNLWRNKLRSILTILAVTVGSFAIIISLAIQTGTKSFIDDQFSALGGDNVMSIYPKATVDNMESMLSNSIVEYNEESTENGLTSIDANKIKEVKKIKGIKADSVVPYANLYVDYITSKETEKKYRINLEHLFSDSFNIEVSSGTKLDNKAKENQILLPVDYVEKLGFQDADSIAGKEVTLAIAQPIVAVPAPVEETKQESNDQENKQENKTESNTTTETTETTKPEQKFTELKVTVMGIIKKSMLAYSASGYALVNSHLSEEVQKENEKSLPESERGKTFILQAEHEKDANVDQIKADLEKIGLNGSTKTEAIEEVHNFLDVITIILYAFGGIALLVASIGIINTLLMSVQERTKEIGLNKALGMSSLRIFNIFSLESILLGFWGAAIGTLAAYGVGKIGDQLLHREGQLLADFPDFHIVKFTILNIAIVIAIVMIIAFIAGTLPAIRAARKNPIQSLRHE